MDCDALGANVALEQVWSASIDGVFVLDELGRCVLFSSGCERLTGLSSAAVLGMDWRTGADEVDGPAEVAILAKL
ncbi:MAG: PAS domain S-box protein, partial [bacterium]|nr:PAS domain S-box protein [bacterium]